MYQGSRRLDKMDDCSEITLKSLCCTCLSNDRKLFQLCRVNNGVNNLYSLLSYDPEAYREGFFKDAASLHICWECEALLRRLARFRGQACAAQRQLTRIADGRNDVKTFDISLSRLLITKKSTYDLTLTEVQENDNFIDCGLGVDVKVESYDDLDDIPLSELHDNYLSENDSLDKMVEDKAREKRSKNKTQKVKLKNKKESCKSNYNDYFALKQMSEEEMLEFRERRKAAVEFVSEPFKCESCVEVFKTQVALDKHNERFHVEKDGHSLCPTCLRYVPSNTVSVHTARHRVGHDCVLCGHRSHTTMDMKRHFKSHGLANDRKKGEKKTMQACIASCDETGGHLASTDEATPHGFPCPECGKYFKNKNLRWKHIQRHHREGYSCSSCGKRFAFKNNLSRHELTHSAPPPRESCPTCRKMVRVDLMAAHARIHTPREQVSCVECGKSFVSRASYDQHLKYAQAHAGRDVLKYKCSVCDKGYRSRGELRDHANYRHAGQTRHQCPVCGKALATRRCITRHVRRAHHGLKEGPRDKVCQLCGKAFRDKKGLREHEFTHTGERPLSCEVCGCTFRQSASLYTHRKRVHKIYPQKTTITVAREGSEQKVEATQPVESRVGD